MSLPGMGAAHAESLVAPPGTVPTVPATLTAAQRAAFATDLIQRWRREVSRQPQGDPAAWASKLRTYAATADPANLARATTMRTLDGMHIALTGGTAEQLSGSARTLGSTVADTTYTPLPNGRCRVADSRVIASMIPAGTYRSIDTEDVSSYASQGGNGTVANGDGSANCGIPPFATSLAVSVFLFTPSADGVFKMMQNGDTWQRGNTVVYNGGSYGASADLIVRSCQSCAEELSIYSSASVHYVIDVIGYFMPAEATALECVNAQLFSPTIAVGSTSMAFGNSCPSGYTRTSTICDSNSADMPLLQVGDGTCKAKNNGSSSAILTVGSTCCRVPGR